MKARISGAIALLLFVAHPSFAQDAAPLPQLPPSSEPADPPPTVSPAPSSAPLPPLRMRGEPGEYEYVERPAPVHAPKYSLWTGARIGAIGFLNSFYVNEVGAQETTGGFVKPGVSGQLDLGARLAYRYIPYAFFERSILGAGRHFENTSTSAWSNYFGIGFRYLLGDPHTVAFASDLSVGYREVSVSNSTGTYTMSTIEYFKLGLGADIRLSNMITLSPMATISTGVMTDASGSILYSDSPVVGQNIPLTHPTYQNGTSINNQTGYLVLGVGVAAHFDLFGSSPPY